MYYFTTDIIVQANKNIASLDPKLGGILCILQCLENNITENVSYTINGEQLRRQLSMVFDKESKESFENAKPSYIIFAKDWASTFFKTYIKNKIDLLSCAIFFLRRQGFEKEYTHEEIIKFFIDKYNLQNYKDLWFYDSCKLNLDYNQRNPEENQAEFYIKMKYTGNFKSILFNNVIQKSAADLKAAGQIQTLYSGSAIHKCMLLSDEPLDQYYIMSTSNQTDEENSSLESEPENSDSITNELVFTSGYTTDFPRNIIYFGAPGTGKSFTLNEAKDKLLSRGGEYERVTFHPDYSYAHFVGAYKPVSGKDDSGNDIITYEYVPGPFMRTLVKALRNCRTDKPTPYLLIIEEINRANVAAVFGDVFQLLDRNAQNVSEYSIQASEDMKKYLAKELGGEMDDYSEIRIPDNYFIWASMNSADQGVFPMDTAFKRRWDFTYLGIDEGEHKIAGKKITIGSNNYRRTVEWNNLRKAINEQLLTYKVNEDKLMGPFFISMKNIPTGDEFDSTEFSRIFKNKVLMYLFDDAAKQRRQSLFEGCDSKSRNQYSKICEEFDKKGVFIFCKDISDKFINTAVEEDNTDEQ